MGPLKLKINEKKKQIDKQLEEENIRIVKESWNNYELRKIKVKLQELGYQVSLLNFAKSCR